MPMNLAKSIQSLLERKRMVADKEKQLIDDLNQILPDMGYRIVPREGAVAAGEQPAAGKTYMCRICNRRFGHWLHLGRHMSAMHAGKKAAGRKRRTRQAAAEAKKVPAKRAA